MRHIVLSKANEYIAAVPAGWVMQLMSCGRKRWAFVWLRKFEPGDEYLPFGEKEDLTKERKK